MQNTLRNNRGREVTIREVSHPEGIYLVLNKMQFNKIAKLEHPHLKKAYAHTPVADGT